jgi:hypothetical protein
MNGISLDSIQDAIDKTSGLLRAESFSELNGFVQCNFGRNVFTVEEFEGGDAQDDSID